MTLSASNIKTIINNITSRNTEEINMESKGFDIADKSTDGPRFKIGTKFIRNGSKGKRKDIETIEDVYTTTNSKGKIVKVVYVVSHDFMGQKVFDYEVADSTIARSDIQK